MNTAQSKYRKELSETLLEAQAIGLELAGLIRQVEGGLREVWELLKQVQHRLHDEEVPVPETVSIADRREGAR